MLAEGTGLRGRRDSTERPKSLVGLECQRSSNPNDRAPARRRPFGSAGETIRRGRVADSRLYAERTMAHMWKAATRPIRAVVVQKLVGVPDRARFCVPRIPNRPFARP